MGAGVDAECASESTPFESISVKSGLESTIYRGLLCSAILSTHLLATCYVTKHDRFVRDPMINPVYSLNIYSSDQIIIPT